MALYRGDGPFMRVMALYAISSSILLHRHPLPRGLIWRWVLLWCCGRQICNVAASVVGSGCNPMLSAHLSIIDGYRRRSTGEVLYLFFVFSLAAWVGFKVSQTLGSSL